MILDLVGERYGKLTVLERVIDETKRSKWLCQCDCGNKKVIRNDALRAKVKPTRSCGCVSSNAQDLTGRRFALLTVIEDTGKRSHRKKIYKCRCDCGNISYVPSYSLNNGGTKSCGCLIPIISSESNRGERHPNYNPNLTDEDRMARRYILNKESHKTWRTSIFERDDYTCQKCGARNNKGNGSAVKLNAHHLDGWHWFEEGRFDVNNGVTLCYGCHMDFHDKYGRKHNTKEQFEEYIQALA